ncbi:MAG TPA: hypothetical protein VF585_09565 [Chthoniobacterales bacterium]
MDTRDIAELTAVVLTEKGHHNKTYNINGPEPLSGPQAAANWSDALGQPIQYSNPDLNEWESQMRGVMGSAWLPFDMRLMFQGYQERGFIAEPTDASIFEKAVGHAPRSYADFVTETVAHWGAEAAPLASH